MLKPPDKVKMKDVAERAGVSLMAVSLALREDQSSNRVGAETRERILQAARELSYYPNARGRVLRLGVTNVIGLYAGYGFVNVRLPYFTEVVSGLQSGCEEFGKDLLLHGNFRNRPAEEIYAELRDGRIDGLVVSMAQSNPLARLLVGSHLPVVAIADALQGIPSVVVDESEGSRLLADHLVAKGYRSCWYMRADVEPSSASRRRVEFLSYAPSVGLAVREVAADTRRDPDPRALGRWLSADKAGRPQALVCWNDTSAYDVLTECRHHGIDVPGEMAVTGFDGCPTPFEQFQTLTTIRAPWASAAQLAVKSLNDLIGGTSVPDETVLPVELVEGNTA